MVNIDKLTFIGRILKTHGVSGELTAQTIIDTQQLSSFEFLWLRINGLNIPFAIESVRAKSHENVIIKLADIDDEKDSIPLCGKEIFVNTELLLDEDTEGAFASAFIGYTIKNAGDIIGTLSDIDDSTENALFVVETFDKKTVLIPIAEEFIVDIDSKDKTITMSLPHGLLDI